jgi:iron complex outermembrane receptor protein
VGPGADPTSSYFPSGERSWNSFTPRASIKYDISPSANVYFSYSQGFKSGVFDATSPAAVPVVNPEKLYAYEVGFKGRVADWLNLTAAGYYYDYKDIQIVFFVDGPGGLPLASLGNVGGAKIKGLELDANMNFGRHFDARIGLNYLDTKYNGFDAASVAVPNGQTYCVSSCGANQVPVQGRTLLGTPNHTGTHTEGYNANGNSLIHAPNFTIYGTANFHADVAGGILDVSGTIYHSSTLFFTFDHRVNQPSWENIDARIAWSPANDKFTIAAFGKNLTNKAVLSGTFIQAAADGVSYSPPRTYGVELDVRF